MNSHFFDAGGRCPVDQSAEVVDVAVDTAIGAESQQVEGASAVP